MATPKPAAMAAKKKYRVASGQSITTRESVNGGDVGDVQYNAGDEIELTEAEAAKIPHAVESGERRTRSDGQTRRLKRQVAELEAENARLKADAETKANAKKDPQLAAALESIKNRGDNHAARGEPDPGKVPPEVVDAFDAQPAPEDAKSDARTDVKAPGSGASGSTENA